MIRYLKLSLDLKIFMKLTILGFYNLYLEVSKFNVIKEVKEENEFDISTISQNTQDVYQSKK